LTFSRWLYADAETKQVEILARAAQELRKA
jgi:hypothetical protein